MSVWDVGSYQLTQTGVEFSTQDALLQAVFDDCERLCLENRKVFGDYEVLIEGAKYNGVWLETQPLGGEMYAKRDLKVALANMLIFLRYQRKDGKFPGMISHRSPWLSVAAHYDWMQGCFLPYSAFKLYYLIGEDRRYLEALYEGLRDFDNYLWSCRDSTGDGCLESWCIWDTGEDNCTVHMLHGAKMPEHGAWGASTPPADQEIFPHKSPQYMAYSFACRRTLAQISRILENAEEEVWLEKAQAVRAAAEEKLWDKEKHAFFIKNKKGEFIHALTQENIKCMYSGLMTREMADQFLKEHLLNEEEFWTPYPFPAIAANDPYFHVNSECSNCQDKLAQLDYICEDIDDNSWSGPLSGLIWQRSVGALLNYGYHKETVMAGKRILALLKRERRYVQNYHPFTGKCAKGQDGYGPTMLAALEYISLLCGVNISCGKILWSAAEDMGTFSYTQHMFGKAFTLRSDGCQMSAYIDGDRVFSHPVGARLETDLEGNMNAVHDISTGAKE